jgi:tetratricopeptide (TPR) repeat protein
MADPVECYRILGIKQGANLLELKQAYRDQVKVWHPDAFHKDAQLQKRAQEQLKKVNIAYRQILENIHAAPHQETILSDDESAANRSRPFSFRSRALKAALPAVIVIALFMTAWFAMKDQFAELLYNVGVAFSDSARHGESIYALRLARFIMPNEARFSIALGKSYQEKNRYDEAEKAYARALQIEPGNQEALRWLALLYMDQNRFYEALSTFADALELDPSNPALLFDLGILYGRLGLTNLRRDIQKKAIQLDLSFDREVQNDDHPVYAPSASDGLGAVEKNALSGKLAEQVSRIEKITGAPQ